jgi:hypothetical protein
VAQAGFASSPWHPSVEIYIHALTADTHQGQRNSRTRREALDLDRERADLVVELLVLVVVDDPEHQVAVAVRDLVPAALEDRPV